MRRFTEKKQIHPDGSMNIERTLEEVEDFSEDRLKEKAQSDTWASLPHDSIRRIATRLGYEGVGLEINHIVWHMVSELDRRDKIDAQLKQAEQDDRDLETRMLKNAISALEVNLASVIAQNEILKRRIVDLNDAQNMLIKRRINAMDDGLSDADMEMVVAELKDEFVSAMDRSLAAIAAAQDDEAVVQSMQAEDAARSDPKIEAIVKDAAAVLDEKNPSYAEYAKAQLDGLASMSYKPYDVFVQNLKIADVGRMHDALIDEIASDTGHAGVDPTATKKGVIHKVTVEWSAYMRQRLAQLLAQHGIHVGAVDINAWDGKMCDEAIEYVSNTKAPMPEFLARYAT